MTKTLISISLVSVTLSLLLYLSPLLSRYVGGIWTAVIFLFIFIGFIWLIVKLFQELVRLARNRSTFRWTHLLPGILIVLVLCFTWFNTLSLDEDTIYGKVIFRACYEGTQNQATFKLREGNKSELHWTGVFFYDRYFTGTYQQVGDTLLLDYETDLPGRFGERVLMDNQQKLLITISQVSDSSKNFVPFYYGYCLGLN